MELDAKASILWRSLKLCLFCTLFGGTLKLDVGKGYLYSGGKNLNLQKGKTLATQQIAGVDYCPYAEWCTSKGVEVPLLHTLNCTCCLLEYRRVEAYIRSWPRVSHDIAPLMFSEQAKMFRDGRDHSKDRDHRRFYGHLANCTSCTNAFALVLAGLQEPDNDIIARHWPLPTDQSAQNGHYLTL